MNKQDVARINFKICLCQIDSYRNWGIGFKTYGRTYEAILAAGEEIVKFAYKVAGVVPDDIFISQNHWTSPNKSSLVIYYDRVWFVIRSSDIKVTKVGAPPLEFDLVTLEALADYLKETFDAEDFKELVRV